MNEQQFYTIQENYKERFFQLPKVFFTNPNYMNLKNVSKIAYAILQDRLQLSIKNKWVDDVGRIYFVYTDKKLMEILNISKNHVTTVKKELKNAGLLIQKRQGLNKPNISYLLKPKITNEDIHKIESAETDVEPSNDKDSHTEGIQIHTQRESRFTHRGNLDSHTEGTSDTDISDTDISDTDISDMNDVNDTYNVISESSHNTHSSHSNHQSQSNDILSTQEEIQYELQEFPEHLAQYITNYTLPEVRIIKGVILKAKRSFHDERAQEIMHPYALEDIEQELINVLKRFRIVLKKKNESVESMQSYLMRCVKSEFEEIHALHMRQQHMPKDNIFKF